ncbi:MAG TPA: hypothetical protein DD490_17180 [Acidobacteria bacterium]|nr:hypothetical protein [Acidobacteriota bacterium]
MRRPVPCAVLLAFGLIVAVAHRAAAQTGPATVPARVAQIEARLRAAEGRERYELLVELTALYFDEDEMAKILEPGEAALELQPLFPDPARELALLKALLHGYAYRRDLSRALAVGLRAEALGRSAGSTQDRAFIARRLGDVYRYRSEMAPALARYTEARSLYGHLGDDQHLGYVLNNIGLLYTERADHARTLEYYLLARAAFERGGDIAGVILTTNNIGTCYAVIGRYGEAQASYETAVRRAEESGNEDLLATCLRGLGAFWVERKEPQRALPLLRRALALVRKIGRRGHLSDAHRTLGDALAALGDAASALREYESALAVATELGLARDQAESWRGMARIQAAQGRPAQAVGLLERAVGVFRSLDNEESLIPALAELAASYAALGRHREAFLALQENGTLQSKTWDRETRRSVLEMQSRFEAKEKERQIQLLTKDQALQAAELRRQRQLRLGLVAAFAAVLAILGLLFNRYRLGVRAARLGETLALERRVNEQLREVDRMKDRFLATTTAELRTPVLDILGLTGLLLGAPEGDLPAAAREALGTLAGSAQRLQRLVGDVLDFSQIREGGLALDRQPVALQGVVEAALALVQPFAAGKPVALRAAVPADLPPVSADARRLEQILLNLLGNAIKFTDAGEVEVSAGRAGERVWIAVRDTGIGIAPEHQERIFQAFEQADGSAERRHGGTGLGLAVSRKLAELHGGTLDVRSVPGAGSTFTVSLPVAAG